MIECLLFSQIYPPQQGGAATFYSNLVKEQKDKVNYHIICENTSGEKAISTSGTVNIYRILPNSDRINKYIHIPLEIIIVIMVTTYFILMKNIDVIHAHSSRISNMSIGICAIVFGTPILYDCRDTGFITEIITIGPVHRWFSCAPNIDEVLLKSGISNDKITRLPVINPPFVSKYRKINQIGSRLNLIYVGSLLRRKGIYMLPSILEYLREHNIDAKITVIGAGKDGKKLKKAFKNKDLIDYVNWLGEINHKQAVSHIGNHDILLLPSESEGIPRVILEAQEVGTPVVTSDVGSVNEISDDKVDIIISDRDSNSFAKEIMWLYENEEMYVQIAKRGINKSKEKDWEQICNVVYDAYISETSPHD